MRLESSGDMLGLVAELNCRRIAMITGKMAKRQGGKLDLHKRILQLLTTARRIHHRYTAGDYRHEQAEADELRDLCQWLVQQHNALEGRADSEAAHLEWNNAALSVKEPLARGVYEQLILSIHEGDIDDLAKATDA